MPPRHMGLPRAKRAVLLAALAVVCAACLDKDPIVAAPADLRPTLEAFRQSALEITARDKAGGLTVAVVDADKVIWAEGFGWADREKRVKAGPETIYRIGSLSKTFTAVVLMQLVDKGFGIQIRPTGFIGHSGGVSGYTAFFDFDPKTRLGVIVLSNGLAVQGNSMLQRIVQVRTGN